MRQTAYSLLTVVVALTVTIDTSHAQRGGFGGRGFGDRGGDRGGFDRSRMFGGDRGDRGSRGGFGDRGSSGRSWGGDRGGSSEGRPQFDPARTGSRIAGFFDRNRDGQIDPQELERMPSSFRERFRSAGIDMSRGVSVEEFGRRAGEAIQSRMSGRDFGEDSRRGRGDDDRRDSRGDGARTSSGRSVFKQSERKKMLQTLPEEYTEGDSDGDGQIALFEWAAWKRSDMFAFFELDENQDGFLTPRELNQADGDQDRGIVMKRERLAVSSGSSGRSGGSSRVRSAGGGSSRSARSPDETSRETSRANYYFTALDRDRDGMISEDEWGRSRTVRGTLERAGVQIRPMSKDTFVSTYVEASGKLQASGDDRGQSDPRRSWGDRGSRGDDRGSRGDGGDRGRGGFDRSRFDRGSFSRGDRGDRGR